MKKNLNKRILSLVLCLQMILTLIPAFSTEASSDAKTADNSQTTEIELAIYNGETEVADVVLPQNDKVELSAKVEEQENVVPSAYQWQIKAGETWVDIAEANKAEIEVTYALVANLLQNETVSIRNKATINGAEVYSEAITVTVEYPVETTMTVVEVEPVVTAEAKVVEGPVITAPSSGITAEELAALEQAVYDAQAVGEEAAVQAAIDAYMAAVASTVQTLDMTVESDIYYTVIIEYLIGSESVARSYIVSVKAGSDYSATVTSPSVLGYAPDKEKVVIDIQNIDVNTTYTVNYEPVDVDFTVSHHLQNANDNGYLYDFLTETKQQKTGYAVGNTIHKTENDEGFEGFVVLDYLSDTPVLADGTTHVDIYYDRMYYLISFELGENGYGVDPIYARYGTNVGAIGAPTRVGYTFMGWTLDSTKINYEENMEGLLTSIDPSTLVPAENVTYYACWKPVDMAKVTVVYWGENAPDGVEQLKDNSAYIQQWKDFYGKEPFASASPLAEWKEWKKENNIDTEGVDFDYPFDEAYPYVFEGRDGDGYSFYGSDEIYVSPDTSLIFGDNSEMICKMKEGHTHSDECGATCGMAYHEHTNDCYKIVCQDDHDDEGHTDECYGACLHVCSLECYKSYSRLVESFDNIGKVYTAKNSDSQSYTQEYIEMNGLNGLYYKSYGSSWYYYLYIDGIWYEDYYGDSYEIIYNCIHSHERLCLSSNLVCLIPVHVHDYLCNVSCGMAQGHRHNDSCYIRPGVMDSSLWELDPQKTTSVIVDPDGSTILNVYYNRKTFSLQYKSGGYAADALLDENGLEVGDYYTSRYDYVYYGVINAKWGTNISEAYRIIAENAIEVDNAESPGEWDTVKGIYSWTPENAVSTNNLTVHFDLMPKEDDTLYAFAYSGNSTANYYFESVMGDGTYPEELKKQYTSEGGKTDVNLNDVDRFEFEGFTHYKNHPNGTKNGESYDGANLYYLRNRYDLILNNGETNQFIFSDNSDNQYSEVEGRGILYEYPMSNFKQYESLMTPPSYYEPGCYTFGGFYLTNTFAGDRYSLDEHIVMNEEGKKESVADNKMPADNLILYAKWDPVQHDVKIYTDNTKTTQIGETQSVTHRTFAVEPEPPERNYHFVGWFYEDENGEEKAFSFNMPIVRDTEVYAKWSSQTPVAYTIRYVAAVQRQDGAIIPETNEDGSLKEIAASNTVKIMGGSTKAVEAKVGSELLPGYQSNYYPTVATAEITADPETDNAEYIFYYVYMTSNSYTVEYRDAATGEIMKDENGREVKSKTIDVDGTITVVTESFVPITEYAPDAYQKTLILSADPQYNVITFWYTYDPTHAPVQVIHYIQNADGEGYTEHQQYTDLNGVIGSPYSAAVLNIMGFEFSNATAGDEAIDATENSTTVESIVSREGLVLKLYYDRIAYPYEFKFVKQGSDVALANSITGVALFGSDVTQEALKIDGYKCISNETQTITIQTEDGNSAVKNMRVFYYAEAGAAINYVAVGPGILSTTYEYIQESDQVIGSTPIVSSGVKFVGWYTDITCMIPVEENDLAEIDESTNKLTPKANAEGEFVEATYYAKFELSEQSVTIEYQVVGIGGSVDVEDETLMESSGEASGSTPTADDGYSFVGWFLDEGCTQQITVGVDATTNKLTPQKNSSGKYETKIYYVKFEKIVADLIITKDVANTDEGRSFIFDVTKVDDESFKLTVVIEGSGSITIKDLPIGTYKVTENTKWSWRYAPSYMTNSVASDGQITLTTGTNTVTVTNTIDTQKGGNWWIDGAYYVKNTFAKLASMTN